MTMRRGITALIVAGGSGHRAGEGVPKQYRQIAGQAVLARAIDALAAHPAIETVQVVIGAGHESLYADAIGPRALPAPLIGGATRRESVLAGLAAIATDRVLIHDAARPFLPSGVIDRLVAALETTPGAVPALAVVDSLARSGDDLGDPVPRDGLVRVQTPQAFRTADIIAAHAAWPEDLEATDDAQVLRVAGGSVAIVAGDARLEKLTYESDFTRARQLVEQGMTSRTGMGFDVHAFGGDGPVWLCGVAIPHVQGLAGHSDADVALHALTDALLGAAALGDIGDHFPPSDPQWKGAPSRLFLDHAAGLVRAAGGIIDHVDLTLICEAPKVGPHRTEMRAKIAEILQVDPDRVSVKATTTERLGFTGRGEGIAAQAIATIRIQESA